jgi:hypothetical protein
MVKKIRVVEEQSSAEEMDKDDFQKKLLEYLHQIDWKLWELLKIEQARNGDVTLQDAPVAETKKKSTFKSIRVDEE